jgi:hypothetical protein
MYVYISTYCIYIPQYWACCCYVEARGHLGYLAPCLTYLAWPGRASFAAIGATVAVVAVAAMQAAAPARPRHRWELLEHHLQSQWACACAAAPQSAFLAWLHLQQRQACMVSVDWRLLVSVARLPQHLACCSCLHATYVVLCTCIAVHEACAYLDMGRTWRRQHHSDSRRSRRRQR